jgi:hypothetical protein
MSSYYLFNHFFLENLFRKKKKKIKFLLKFFYEIYKFNLINIKILYIIHKLKYSEKN